MLSTIFASLFGTRNNRLLADYRKKLARINQLSDQYSSLSDAQLQAKTAEFKQRIDNGAKVDDLLFDAFAAAREASSRILGMRHFDVQLIAGMVLNDGNISEMRTGEGKTLMATLPAYLNALAGKGVHVVTVNDYLAKRDAQWMSRLYNFMGLSVGINLPNMEREDKKQAYDADITYGTNNEFGFDYLRDNLVIHPEARAQRPLFYAIVDEVDSILIDEARTPLIISGPSQEQVATYQKIRNITDKLVPQKQEPTAENPDVPGDYFVDEKNRQVHLSDEGLEKIEKMLVVLGVLAEGDNLYAPANISLMHYINATMKAHFLFHKDQHYVVQNGEVIIVDDFTGRLMAGRRWSDGLHQAVEAKEGVAIQQENQTLASITFQNYFRMYQKLSGMTGTADTEAYEFQKIYDLETVIIPTHRPMVRKDQNDLVFMSTREKYQAILMDVQDCQQRGQPVLIGTATIETSEILSKLFSENKVDHQVLNAKQHAREADIVIQAGLPGAITIATNMAGRGTDIVLGGNIEKQIALIEADEQKDEAQKHTEIEQLKRDWLAKHDQVKAAGGLRVIGSERHESRRIDNQLRGRSGRQGDPGSSRFYLSMEDSLLRIFAGDRMRSIMQKIGLPEGEPIESGMVSRSIETAQKRVEGQNFEIRKQLLEYDDVANQQRKILYEQRNHILEAESVSHLIDSMSTLAVEALVSQYASANVLPESWDLTGLSRGLGEWFAIELDLSQWFKDTKNAGFEDLLDHVKQTVSKVIADKRALVGVEQFGRFERIALLELLDQEWRKHLTALDHLRQSIHLRGIAQKNPKDEYKRDALLMFQTCLNTIRDEVAKVILRVQIQSQEEIAQEQQRLEVEQQALEQQAAAVHTELGDISSGLSQDSSTSSTSEEGAAQQPYRRSEPKVGRNDPCPCGSGKKYKQCHGKVE